jgi:5,10-methylenetetrahydromethanopterin reductase
VRTGIWIFPGRPAGELVDAIVAAEQAGIDEVWVGDEGAEREPFTVLAGAAARTDRVRLGVGVTNAYARHPLVTAWQAETLLELSDGRFVLGLGPAGSVVLGRLGVRPVRSLTDCRRALSQIRTASQVPVFVGARGERFNRWASEIADGVLVAGVPLPFIADVLGWAGSVRPIEVSLLIPVCFTDGQLETFRRDQRLSLLEQPPEVRELLGVDSAALSAGEDPNDTVLAACGLWGTTGAIVDRLRWIVARFQPTTIGLALPVEGLIDNVDRAAEVFAGLQSRS